MQGKSDGTETLIAGSAVEDYQEKCEETKTPNDVGRTTRRSHYSPLALLIGKDVRDVLASPPS
jgi:hypothetical protein